MSILQCHRLENDHIELLRNSLTSLDCFALLILWKAFSLLGQVLGTVLRKTALNLSNLYCNCKSVIQKSGQKEKVKCWVSVRMSNSFVERKKIPKQNPVSLGQRTWQHEVSDVLLAWLQDFRILLFHLHTWFLKAQEQDQAYHHPNTRGYHDTESCHLPEVGY